VDASLLWLAQPFGLVRPDEPAFVQTLHEVDAELDLDGGIRRYPIDTYFGGGAWPVLAASLGWCHAMAGDDERAWQRHRWITEQFSLDGRLGEQFGGERRDPAKYREWVDRWGPPAKELLWSHAMFVVLSDELERTELARPAG
jgi:GH15 family glucan-1,4-alpha-glucosidase